MTGPLTFRVEEIEQIATGMARLRAQPPSELAGSPVVEVSDLAQGYKGLPPTDGVLVLTEAAYERLELIKREFGQLIGL